MEWVRLGDLGKIITGNTPSKKNLEFYKTKDIPFIGPSDIKNFREVNHIYESEDFISHIARSKARIVPKNSILVTCIGNIGKVGKVEIEEIAFNQQINAIIVEEQNFDVDYLLYALIFNQKRLEVISNAPVVPIINKTAFSDFKIKIDKSIRNQKHISKCLNFISELIILRKQQIQAYDDLIESLFFEIINKSPINEVSFDDMFEIIDGDRGKNYPKKNDLLEEGYCLFLNTKNVTKTGFKFDQQEFITKEKDEKLRKGRAKIGDFILTTRGTVGNIAYINENIEFKNIRINSGMVILRKKLIINPKFFEVLIRKTNILSKAKSGSAQPQLPIKSLKKVLIPTVDIELQNKFADYVIKIEEEKKELNSSLKELEDLFDALMQDAFSGNLFKD